MRHPSHPGVWSPAFFLLLLLPPTLLSARSFQHRLPGWLDFHHFSLGWRNLHRHFSPNKGSFHHRRSLGSLLQDKQEDANICMGAYDLYIVLDMSGKVDNNWIHIYNFVEAVVNKFQNSKVRMSFILYSTHGKTLMNLTSNRNEIQEGLNKLRDTVPTGSTNLNAGLQKANEQITKEFSKGKKIPSVIITLTDGALLPNVLEAAKLEVEKAQKMGAIIYCVGVNDFKTNQLLEITGQRDFVFEATHGFKTLANLVDPLIDKSCMEISSAESSNDCIGESYELMVSGKGFHNARHKEDVVCRFKFSKSKYFDEAPTSVDDTNLVCPGVKINKADEEVFIEVSLDGGNTFINNNVSIISKDCTNYMSEQRGVADLLPVPGIPGVPGLPDIPGLGAAAAAPFPFNPLFLAIIPILLLLLLICWCCWRSACCHCCCRSPPPPTVIVPCCQCRYGRIRRMECKLDALCNFVQNCNAPMICCQPRCKKKFFNFNLLRPHNMRVPCCPNYCIQPSQECYPLNSCISQCQQAPSICAQPPTRMLPLIYTPAQPYCKATLSLPPP